MIRWPLVLDQHIREVCGPEDEFDDETNGDPDSVVGEEDERGFDDGPDEPDELFAEDDGFDDAEASEDEGDDEDDE
jgi:hypothetical protein